MLLRQLCPPGAERKELESLIKQTQTRLAPFPIVKPGEPGRNGETAVANSAVVPAGSFIYLRRENHKLQRQIVRLEALVQRRTEQLRILEGLATDLQREISKVKAGQMPAPMPLSNAATAAQD